MKIRIDELLFLKKLSPTRSQAKQLIFAGKVFVRGIQINKPAQKFDEDIKIELKNAENYVGRGAYKIKEAIEKFGIDPQDKIAADIGASTGGFTDFLLQNGAEKVYAIDVGHNQLAEKLRNDPRVINMEGQNIRKIKALPEKTDLCVVDLSYISLRLVLENIFNLAEKNADVVTLFKPQFEAGPKARGKDGVIKDEEILMKTLEDFREWCEQNNFKIKNVIPSPIKGKQGNREFLIHFKL